MGVDFAGTHVRVSFKVHAEKMDSLADPLVKLKLAKVDQYPWYYMETETARDFMEYLAAVLGKLDDLRFTPITDNQESLERFILASTKKGSPRNLLESLRCDVLEELFPAPAQPLTAGEIADFKHKHGDLLTGFRRHVEKQLVEIVDINDSDLRQYRMDLFRDETNERLCQIKARMEESGWVDLVLGEARKGKPGHRVKRAPTRWAGKRCRQAEEYCERESPPDADGESYQA